MIRFENKKNDKRIVLQFKNITKGNFFITKLNNLALKYSESYAWVFFVDTKNNANISSVQFSDHDDISSFVAQEPEIYLTVSNQPQSFGSVSRRDIFFFKGHYYIKCSEDEGKLFTLPFFSETELEMTGTKPVFNTYDAVYPVSMTVIVLED